MHGLGADDEEDDEAADDDDAGAERAPRKKNRRVRTSDDDPLAFSKMPTPAKFRAYNDREHYAKTIYKPFVG